MEGNIEVAKKLNKIAIVITVVVLSLVFFMRSEYKLDLGMDFNFLPPVSATLNTLVAICLLIALYFIKQKNISAHQRSINLAMFLSFLFLISYVLYHFTTIETKYCGEGSIRIIYFLLLISHIILAAVSFPLILFAYIKGYTGQVAKHRKMVKWVYPLWLYVAISGPLCYLMLMPCY
jgi:putative membrane protein